MWRGWMVVFVLLAFTPLAAAIPAAGVLHADGGWRIQGGSRAGAEAIGLYVADLSNADSILLTAPRLNVTVIESRVVSAGVVELAPDVRQSRFEVTDAQLTFANEPEGWMGFYYETAKAVRLEGAGTMLGAKSEATAYGNGAATPEPTPTPTVRAYSLAVQADHIGVTATGSFSFDGPFALKLMGADLLLRAKENTTTIVTGSERTTGLAGDIILDRWVFLELAAGQASLTTSSALLPSTSVNVDLEGELILEKSEGALRGAGFEYIGTGAPATLRGELNATFLPDARAARTSISIDGDIISTNLAQVRVANPGGARPLAFFVVGTTVVLAAGVAGYLGTRARQARKEHETADELSRKASEAMEAEDYDLALIRIREARRLAPSSVRLRIDEGFALQQVGETDAALRAYAQVAELSPDGEAEYMAFLLLRETDPRSAADWLIRALDKDPSCVLTLDDAVIGSLADRPEVLEAIHRAHARIR